VKALPILAAGQRMQMNDQVKGILFIAAMMAVTFLATKLFTRKR